MTAEPVEDRRNVHLLTVAEAAAYLNVPQRWVADAVRARRIRCTRIGKHVRFRPADLEELIVAGEQPVLDHPSKVAILRHASSARSHL
ncbi:hypothetical protein BHE97_06390 [Aeromicrobium sp. PE09-221]|uniref:helix-turn-helix domain-containing protein n=1 Tax=Aeromicrobium sp. PE09-221 TaxID=1898043 RepID=UPI000B3EA5DC|nr:helix-turn-helix domain-containing protein [Aeromicrobium sp. PE09-221]OUZ11053.1 hypothetical protein BHE97_06390 [Aeromicrobium sp. PE09-221]